jgi:hypothetical protein
MQLIPERKLMHVRMQITLGVWAVAISQNVACKFLNQ